MSRVTVRSRARHCSVRETPNEQGTVWKDGTWVRILDGDFDPMYGDLGKIDAADRCCRRKRGQHPEGR